MGENENTHAFPIRAGARRKPKVCHLVAIMGVGAMALECAALGN